MQVFTVNEGSNLEAIWPGQVSHQLLFSVGRWEDECTATTDHIWPVSREELFPSEEDTVQKQPVHIIPGVRLTQLWPLHTCRVCLLQTPVWGKMIGSSGIRRPGLESQPYHILSVLPRTSL